MANEKQDKVSVIDNAAAVARFDESIYDEIQQAIPQLKLLIGRVYVVKPTAAIKIGKKLPTHKEGEAIPEMLAVTEMNSGMACEIIVNKGLKDILLEKYPKEGYIGKIFKIGKGEEIPVKSDSKRKFCPIMVVELVAKKK